MKKIISLFLSLTMLLSLTAGLDFSAYAETVKGIVAIMLLILLIRQQDY